MIPKPSRAVSFLKIGLLSLILFAMGCFVLWDYDRVNMDFYRLKSLLTDVRSKTAGRDRILIARFSENQVSIHDYEKGEILETVHLPTLDQVNYNTTLGDDRIVFYKRGTAKYNKRIHGGDIRLKSWLGFRRNLVIRCTGLAREGVYPE